MKIAKSVFLLVLLFIFSKIDAQEIPEFGGAYNNVVGIIAIDEIVPSPFESMMLEPATAIKWSLTPALVSAETSYVAGITFDISKQGHLVQFNALKINPDNFDSLYQYRAGYKFYRSNKDKTLSYGTKIRYSKTEGQNSTFEVFGIVDKSISVISDIPMSLTANIKWTERKYESSSLVDIHAIGGAIGLLSVISPQFYFSMDYSFKDDINEDDTFSVKGLFPIEFGKGANFIIAGIDEHKNLTLAAKIGF